MQLILDFDGTVYGPSVELKNIVVPILKSTLLEECGKTDETYEQCFYRLSRKHNTESLYMLTLLETECSESSLLERTYIKGVSMCQSNLTLRDGILELLSVSSSTSVFTNAPVAWVNYLSEYFDISNHISEVFGMTKKSLLVKPSVVAFNSVPYRDAFFVDDIYGNCVQGAKIGWKSFWFPEIVDVANIEDTTLQIEKISSASEVCKWLGG